MTRLIAMLAALVIPAAANAQLTAVIDGAQSFADSGCEPGGVGTGPSTGTGAATFVFASGELSYDISFTGLEGSELVAHIHGPGAPGTPAGVLFGLPAGSPKVGSEPLTGEQVGWLNNALLYVNIHSSLCPAGEIRGQILGGVPGTPALQPWAMTILALVLAAGSLFFLRRLTRIGVRDV